VAGFAEDPTTVHLYLDNERVSAAASSSLDAIDPLSGAEDIQEAYFLRQAGPYRCRPRGFPGCPTLWIRGPYLPALDDKSSIGELFNNFSTRAKLAVHSEEAEMSGNTATCSCFVSGRTLTNNWFLLCCSIAAPP